MSRQDNRQRFFELDNFYPDESIQTSFRNAVRATLGPVEQCARLSATGGRAGFILTINLYSAAPLVFELQAFRSPTCSHFNRIFVPRFAAPVFSLRLRRIYIYIYKRVGTSRLLKTIINPLPAARTGEYRRDVYSDVLD